MIKWYEPILESLISLTLFVTQVDRALRRWETVVYIDGKGAASYFSGDNYADKTVPFVVNGRKTTKRLRRATMYLKTVESFPEAYWAGILVNADEFYEVTAKRRRKGKGVAVDTQDVVVEDACEDMEPEFRITFD